jgi:hypothetical protein
VLHKAGGVPLAVDQLLAVVRLAGERAQEMNAIVESALREDGERRGAWMVGWG